MGKIINPTKARTNLFSLIKNANRDAMPVIIAGADDNRSAVLMGKRDYDAIQETMNLVMNGQNRVVYTIDKETKTVEIYSCWAHYEGGTLNLNGKSNSQRN
ncbi:type II toxin-antitoxin system prevent-host-death family antitoxin [Dellaglioa sp. L3N]